MSTSFTDAAGCGRAQDAAAFVLGELHGRQRESFARHLRRCRQCADEVELLRHAAEAVPLLAARHVPPPEGEPEAELQLPTLAVAAAAQARQRGVAAAARLRGTTATATPLDRPVLRSIQGGAGAPQSAPGSNNGGRRVLQSPVPKPALVSFLALAVIAVMTVALSGRSVSARYRTIQAGWAGGGAALKLVGNQLELLVEGMPKPKHSNGYQVWVGSRLTGQMMATHSWLHLNRGGEAGANVPGDYHDWYAIAVYVEPRHGPDTTRSGAVIVGDLRNVR